MTDYVGATSSATLLWAGEGYSAFASASATDSDLTISYIDLYGEIKYTYTISKRNEVYQTYAPSQSPLVQLIPMDRTVASFQTSRLLFGGLGVLGLVLLAGAFIYDAKVKNRRKKPKQLTSLLLSYSSPGSSFNEFMSSPVSARHTPGSSRLLSPKNTKFSSSGPYTDITKNKQSQLASNDEHIADKCQLMPPQVLYDRSRRGLISMPQQHKLLLQRDQRQRGLLSITVADNLDLAPLNSPDIQKGVNMKAFEAFSGHSSGIKHKRVNLSLS